MTIDKNLRDTFIEDQENAAVEQAVSTVETIANYKLSSGTAGHYLPPDEPYKFSDTYFGKAYKEVLDHPDEARYCPHLTSSPSVVYSFLGEPGVFGCMSCIFELQQISGEENPTSCDVCSLDSEMFVETCTTAGAIIILGNVCPSCNSEQVQSIEDAKRM